MRSRVLFPAPLAPVRKTNSRLAMWSDTPLSAVVPRGYCLTTFVNRIMRTAGALWAGAAGLRHHCRRISRLIVTVQIHHPPAAHRDRVDDRFQEPDQDRA